MAMSKYHNKKVEMDGLKFDSRKEAMRYAELKLLERAGRIKDLQPQKVKFVLIPAQRDKNGRLLERECAYIADFVYKDAATGETIVEDVKGYKTPEYRMKRKMLLFFHGIRIRET
jgi:hypothetical protein